MLIADLPLQTRLDAVRGYIAKDRRLTVEERHRALAIALWPPDAHVSAGEGAAEMVRCVRCDVVKPGDYFATDARSGACLECEWKATIAKQHRPNKPRKRRPKASRPVVAEVPAELRAEAKRLHQRGASISELAERYGEPWRVVREWVSPDPRRARRSPGLPIITAGGG